MPKRNLGDLVKAASSDLEAPIRRGRGLEGMISGEAGQSEVEQRQQETTSTHVNNTTSTQDSLSTSGQDDKMGEPEPKPVQRVVKSFRLRDDISHRIEIVAAQERRKIYEVVEEALEEYLARRTQ